MNKKAKDKAKRQQKVQMKITLKNVITFLAFVISVLYLIIFYNYYFGQSSVYASGTIDLANIKNIKISGAKKINIEEIINENQKNGQKEEYSIEEATLEYITKYKDNNKLPKGTLQVVQEGREGKQEITTKRIYQNGELINEEQVSCKITKASVNKIVEVGTANYESNYKVKVGDTLYVTSDRLTVRVEPEEQSQKIATLAKDDELKLLEIRNDWYKIASSSIIGYVKAESTTYIDNTPKQQEVENKNTNKIEPLSFDMALNKPSGLSLEQFRKVLKDSKDTNKIF